MSDKPRSVTMEQAQEEALVFGVDDDGEFFGETAIMAPGARPSSQGDTMFQAHQGDVYIRQVKTISGAEVKRESGRIILAHGEVTGHAHAIGVPKATMFRDDALGQTFLQIGDEPAAVTHEEHAAIILPPGLYEVTIQAQYTPAEIQRVVD